MHTEQNSMNMFLGLMDIVRYCKNCAQFSVYILYFFCIPRGRCLEHKNSMCFSVMSCFRNPTLLMCLFYRILYIYMLQFFEVSSHVRLEWQKIMT